MTPERWLEIESLARELLAHQDDAEEHGDDLRHGLLMMYRRGIEDTLAASRIDGGLQVQLYTHLASLPDAVVPEAERFAQGGTQDPMGDPNVWGDRSW